MSGSDGGDSTVGPGGGSTRPWHDYPTPLGVPKQTPGPHVCYQQRVVRGNAFGQPVNCGPLYDSSGHVFDGWNAVDAWLQWLWGSEDNPG